MKLKFIWSSIDWSIYSKYDQKLEDMTENNNTLNLLILLYNKVH